MPSLILGFASFISSNFCQSRYAACLIYVQKRPIQLNFNAVQLSQMTFRSDNKIHNILKYH